MPETEKKKICGKCKHFDERMASYGIVLGYCGIIVYEATKTGSIAVEFVQSNLFCKIDRFEPKEDNKQMTEEKEKQFTRKEKPPHSILVDLKASPEEKDKWDIGEPDVVEMQKSADENVMETKEEKEEEIPILLLCPLNSFVECFQDHCGWWSEHHKVCAIHTLNEIAKSTWKIQQKTGLM